MPIPGGGFSFKSLSVWSEFMLFGALPLKGSPPGRASTPSGFPLQNESVPRSIQGTLAATKTLSRTVPPPETSPALNQEMRRPSANESALDNESRNSLHARPFAARRHRDPERAPHKCDKRARCPRRPRGESRAVRRRAIHCKGAHERGGLRSLLRGAAISRSTPPPVFHPCGRSIQSWNANTWRLAHDRAAPGLLRANRDHR